MRKPLLLCNLLVLMLFIPACRIDSQTNAGAAQDALTYGLNVSVDEVVLTFHATDSHGLPVNDLKLSELSLLDSDKPPRKLLALRLLQDFPIRAGILMDISESMLQHLPGNRAISIQYAQRLLRQQTDQAFVMEFGRLSTILQPWTSDAVVLTAGIHKVTAGAESRLSGTAIFDTIFRTCLYQFGKIDHAASGNFILLFSDGEDNASTTSLKDAVDMCQRANTVIYAFRADSKASASSTGPRTLAELTSQTGGRVFHDDDSEAGIYDDLRTIEADLRNQYRLVYKPPYLKHDGSFHHIELTASDRVDRINIRSGYYAPAR
jgi:Ca-activated chloride channel family protein